MRASICVCACVPASVRRVSCIASPISYHLSGRLDSLTEGDKNDEPTQEETHGYFPAGEAQFTRTSGDAQHVVAAEGTQQWGQEHGQLAVAFVTRTVYCQKPASSVSDHGLMNEETLRGSYYIYVELMYISFNVYNKNTFAMFYIRKILGRACHMFAA